MMNWHDIVILGCLFMMYLRIIMNYVQNEISADPAFSPSDVISRTSFFFSDSMSVEHSIMP